MDYTIVYWRKNLSSAGYHYSGNTHMMAVKAKMVLPQVLR